MIYFDACYIAKFYLAEPDSFRGLSATTFIRAADALHLTCAAEEGCVQIHTNDRHMIAAAPAFGLQAVTL